MLVFATIMLCSFAGPDKEAEPSNRPPDKDNYYRNGLDLEGGNYITDEKTEEENHSEVDRPYLVGDQIDNGPLKGWRLKQKSKNGILVEDKNGKVHKYSHDWISQKPGPYAEMLFLLDATQSMSEYLHLCAKSVKEIAEAVKQKTGLGVRMAFVAYRDFDRNGNPKDLTVVHDFTQDEDKFYRHLSKVRPIGGGDLPEDMEGGFFHAGRLNWSPVAPVGGASIYLFADAPPHGNEWFPERESDHHPDGNPHVDPETNEKINLRALVRRLIVKSNYAKFHFCDIHDWTDIVRREIRKEYDEKKVPYVELERSWLNQMRQRGIRYDPSEDARTIEMNHPHGPECEPTSINDLFPARARTWVHPSMLSRPKPASESSVRHSDRTRSSAEPTPEDELFRMHTWAPHAEPTPLTDLVTRNVAESASRSLTWSHPLRE